MTNLNAILTLLDKTTATTDLHLVADIKLGEKDLAKQAVKIARSTKGDLFLHTACIPGRGTPMLRTGAKGDSLKIQFTTAGHTYTGVLGVTLTEVSGAKLTPRSKAKTAPIQKVAPIPATKKADLEAISTIEGIITSRKGNSLTNDKFNEILALLGSMKG
jgi:hypothetical protein